MIRKLARFLGETANLTGEERLKFKSFFTEEQTEEFGGLLVVLLERADDIEKPLILGRLLDAYARGSFSQEEFFASPEWLIRRAQINTTGMTSRLDAKELATLPAPMGMEEEVSIQPRRSKPPSSAGQLFLAEARPARVAGWRQPQIEYPMEAKQTGRNPSSSEDR